MILYRTFEQDTLLHSKPCDNDAVSSLNDSNSHSITNEKVNSLYYMKRRALIKLNVSMILEQHAHKRMCAELMGEYWYSFTIR